MTSRVFPFAGVVSLAVVLFSTHPLAQANSTFGQGAVRPGNGVTAPHLVRMVEPKYTTEAMRQKIAGNVELEAVVKADGTVGDVRVLKSLDGTYGLDQNAVMAAKQWLFTPGQDQDGRPVPVIVTLILTFKTASAASLGYGQGSDDDFANGTCRVPSEGATSPKLVHQLEPRYTPDAMMAKIEGTVTVEAVVDANGIVARARVIKSLDKVHGLDQEALMAASQWTFEPDSGKCQGLPSPTLVTLVLSFRLH